MSCNLGILPILPSFSAYGEETLFPVNSDSDSVHMEKKHFTRITPVRLQ